MRTTMRFQSGRRPRRRGRRLVLWFGMVAILATSSPVIRAATVTLEPVQDNSIYSESNNTNGGGELFAGKVAGGGGFAVRRALVQFAVAGNIPAGSVINSVTFSLTLSRNGPAGTSVFQINPLLAGWGEGSSVGTGTGAAPAAGDATWNHRFYQTNLWASAGGDFGSASGAASIGTNIGATYTFVSQPGMVTDVQNWLDSPGSNFGWILKAQDETSIAVSAKAFLSSEAASNRPTLMIDYTIPEPGTAVLFLSGLAGFLIRRRA